MVIYLAYLSAISMNLAMEASKEFYHLILWVWLLALFDYRLLLLWQYGHEWGQLSQQTCGMKLWTYDLEQR